ncbi:Uncharacterised protein r2_g4348 [Pycnogonum litorale]
MSETREFILKKEKISSALDQCQASGLRFNDKRNDILVAWDESQYIGKRAYSNMSKITVKFLKSTDQDFVCELKEVISHQREKMVKKAPSNEIGLRKAWAKTTISWKKFLDQRNERIKNSRANNLLKAQNFKVKENSFDEIRKPDNIFSVLPDNDEGYFSEGDVANFTFKKVKSVKTEKIVKLKRELPEKKQRLNAIYCIVIRNF